MSSSAGSDTYDERFRMSEGWGAIGLDTDECRYDNPVVLEEVHDYGPYKRWKKDEYVTDVTA